MKRVLTVLAIVLVAVGGLAVLRDDDQPYTIRMEMDNASGLRSGSPVVVGGVRIGAVDLDADSEKVTVELNIEPDKGPIGRDATAAVVAQNILGQKQVLVDVGDKEGKPAPAGFTLPAPQVRAATDIDQLLGTLDADTRTRLAVVLNEAGIGFAGRKLDFRTFLTDLRPALDAGGQLLEQLTEDNEAIGNLVELSDSYVGSLADARTELGRAIDVFGRTTETVSTRRGELRETLRRAPATLVAARGFLSELRQTTQPLAATARLLERTAPSLSTVLDSIGPLEDAATPTLNTALDHSAPALERLGDVSTRRAASLLPTVKNLANFAENEVPPIGATLTQSTDNLLATLENWSRAIQFRDGLGHIFRGEASFSPDTYRRLLEGLGGSPQSPGVGPTKRKAPRQAAPEPAAPARAPKPPTEALDDLLGGLGGAGKQTQQNVQKLLGGLTRKPLAPGAEPLVKPDGTLPLLDYLLGK